MKILVLVNFVDRSHCPPRVIRGMEEILSTHGAGNRLVKFTSREHSIKAINEARREGFDTLVMGGGDGTIHNLFNLAFEKDFTFGIIPLGTVNALARSLNIPRDPLKALEAAINGSIRNVDVCKEAGRFYT